MTMSRAEAVIGNKSVAKHPKVAREAEAAREAAREAAKAKAVMVVGEVQVAEAKEAARRNPFSFLKRTKPYSANLSTQKQI